MAEWLSGCVVRLRSHSVTQRLSYSVTQRLSYFVTRYVTLHPQAVQEEIAGVVGSRAVEEERLVRGVVFGEHLHGGEDAVALVFGGRGEDDLAVGGQFEVDGGRGVVGEGEAAQFGGAVLEDGDFGLGDDAVVLAGEFDFVAGEGYVVAGWHNIQGGVGGAPEGVGGEVADEEEGAVVVGGDFAVAVEEDVLVARESGSAVVDHDGVFAVADDADFGHIGDAVEVARVALGLHFAVLVALILSHFQVYVGLHLGFLFQQGLHALHDGGLHEEVLQAVVLQVVGQGGQYHALVVGVVGFDGYMVFVVVALEEAVFVGHVQLFQRLHVVVDGAVVGGDGEQRGVGGDDDAVGRGVLELEVWDAEGVVFVVAGVVQFVVGGFADAPGEG